MARQKIATAIDLSGPFFKYEPGKTFRANARVMLAELSREGEADVKVQLRQGQSIRRPLAQPTSLGNRVSDHVVGRVHAWGGRKWQVTAVIGIKNQGWSPLQGQSLMAAGARLESRSHVFRRTAARLRKAKNVNARELLRNIA